MTLSVREIFEQETVFAQKAGWKGKEKEKGDMERQR
jgi:hypothetical protein